MGQVNCQQCIPNLYDISFNNQIQRSNQPLSIPTQMHRINILSKHRNSHQIFTKKYSTQMTRQDTQQQSLQNKSVFKQKACMILLTSSQRSYRVQVQKGKKITVGTSMNCHYHIPRVRDNFKVSIQNINNGIFINDLGVGGGAYVKSQGCVFQRSQKSQRNYTQLFMFNIGDNKLIQILLSESTKTLNQISIKMKNINQGHQHQQQFTFNNIDILLRKQNKRTLFINQLVFIDFQIILNPQNKYQIIFKNNSYCWRYINKRTLLKQNDILCLGFQQFRVKKIILSSSSSDLFNSNQSNSSDIKIVDFQS